MVKPTQNRHPRHSMSLLSTDFIVPSVFKKMKGYLFWVRLVSLYKYLTNFLSSGNPELNRSQDRIDACDFSCAKKDLQLQEALITNVVIISLFIKRCGNSLRPENSNLLFYPVIPPFLDWAEEDQEGNVARKSRSMGSESGLPAFKSQPYHLIAEL